MVCFTKINEEKLKTKKIREKEKRIRSTLFLVEIAEEDVLEKLEDDPKYKKNSRVDVLVGVFEIKVPDDSGVVWVAFKLVHDQGSKAIIEIGRVDDPRERSRQLVLPDDETTKEQRVQEKDDIHSNRNVVGVDKGSDRLTNTISDLHHQELGHHKERKVLEVHSISDHVVGNETVTEDCESEDGKFYEKMGEEIRKCSVASAGMFSGVQHSLFDELGDAGKGKECKAAHEEENAVASIDCFVACSVVLEENHTEKKGHEDGGKGPHVHHIRISDRVFPSSLDQDDELGHERDTGLFSF